MAAQDALDMEGIRSGFEDLVGGAVEVDVLREVAHQRRISPKVGVRWAYLARERPA